jgi:signal transduction histidine kinase
MSQRELIKANILIVDDTPANLNVLSSILSQGGHKVRPAINGEIALMAAFNDPPDLILLDIRMPKMDGYEVCRQLKANPKTAHIPVIFISSLSEIDDKLKAFEAGGVDYVIKPFYLEEVQARVDSQLTLVWQRKRIEALSALKEELISIVSHDLKNPLGVISGYSQMILSTPNITLERAKQLVGRIQGAADMMTNLVTDLLDQDKVGDSLPLELRPVSLADFLSEKTSGLELLAAQKQITLTLDSIPADFTVMIDPNRLGQAVTNLVSNALHYTPSGGQVSVYTQHSTDPGSIHYLICIQDTGIGIPSDALPYIFDRYYRVNTEQHRKVKGNGLGLSIVKQVVELHHGSIEVQSEPGQGSLFTLRLPLSVG